jgi:hypothetical protein
MRARQIFRVMLSSSFVDLEAMRGEIVGLMARHELHEIAMETDAALPTLDRKASSLQKVDNADAYVGIIGHRYGTRVSPEDLSLTELEWRRAKELDIPRCFLLMSSRYPVMDRDAQAASPADRDSLAGFMERVQEDRVCAIFHDRGDFTVKAMQSLEQLRRELDTLHPRSGYQWPRPLDFETYMDEKRGESFQGREWLLGEIERWLRSEEGRALVICADFGVGKSALLAEYVRLNWTREALAFWHFCQHDTPDTLKPGTFVRSLAARLSQCISDYRKAIEDSVELQKRLGDADVDPAGALQMAVLEPLARMPEPDGVQVLVIDALDEALETDRVEGRERITIVDLLAKNSALFPRWLRLLTTSRPIPEVLCPLQAGFTLREIAGEDARNHVDLRRYVLGRVSQASVRSRLGRRTPEAFADSLVDKSGGKFLFVVHALRELVSGRLSVEELLALPPGMDAFYLGRFEPESYKEARNLLGVMCAANEPLPPAVLAEILRTSEESVEEVHERLPDFLWLRSGCLTFDHFST